jgi:hypothetical protein
MTTREVYEGVLMELNKVHAPALAVEEFVYFLNKALLAFTNERYNFYAVNQQLSDDLRVLVTEFQYDVTSADILTDFDSTRYVTCNLGVSNYLHILSCDLIVQNDISHLKKRYAAKRLTLDMYGAIYNNEYLKPAVKRPYYLLLPTNETEEQNNSIVKIFIGQDVTSITPYAVRVYYLRKPVTVTLTDDMVYALTSDTSDVIEFPDYLKNEFIKRVSWYQLENVRDQRASSFPVFNQEIPTIPLELGGGVAPQTQATQ